MSFKLPQFPSARASANELADYAEIYSWLYGSCSARHVERMLCQLDNNDFNVGLDDTDSINEELAGEMLGEFQRRADASREGYPFRLGDSGSTLYVTVENLSNRELTYCYLLLATRLNMKSDRKYKGIDGTQLHEELSASVLKQYLGGERAKTMVFGTAAKGNIADKINQLCNKINEGGEYRTLDTGKDHANDDGLDVVGWIPFTDCKSGKLSVFGQCKTGTSWQESINRLQPDSFISKRMRDSFALAPIKAFFVTEFQNRSQWSNIVHDSKLFFDRCRIIDFMSEYEVDMEILDKITTWTLAVKQNLYNNNWAKV